jgi:hypothetical protein
MLGAVIQMQRTHLRTAQRTAWNHALYGLFKDALRELAVQHLASGDTLDTADVARVAIIDLVGQFLTSEPHLVRIDDNDMVTAINVRRVTWLSLAAQDIGNEAGNTANNQIFCVNEDPRFLDVLCTDRFRNSG